MALLDFSYNPIAPPDSRETDWDEDQRLEPRRHVSTGFIQGFSPTPKSQGHDRILRGVGEHTRTRWWRFLMIPSGIGTDSST